MAAASSSLHRELEEGELTFKQKPYEWEGTKKGTLLSRTCEDGSKNYLGAYTKGSKRQQCYTAAYETPGEAYAALLAGKADWKAKHKQRQHSQAQQQQQQSPQLHQQQFRARSSALPSSNSRSPLSASQCSPGPLQLQVVRTSISTISPAGRGQGPAGRSPAPFGSSAYGRTSATPACGASVPSRKRHYAADGQSHAGDSPAAKQRKREF